MERLAWIGIGGAAGSILRYLTSTAAAQLSARHFSSWFPLGTLIVNVLGSLAIGLVMRSAALGWGISDATRLAITAGLLGGFTTFSSFAYETLELVEQGRRGMAFANVVLNCTLSLAAVWAGQEIANALMRSDQPTA